MKKNEKISVTVSASNTIKKQFKTIQGVRRFLANCNQGARAFVEIVLDFPVESEFVAGYFEKSKIFEGSVSVVREDLKEFKE